MEKQYAKAIDLLIRERGMDEKKVFEQLRTHLRAAGRMKLLPLLLSELKKLQQRRHEEARVLEIASAKERKAAEAYAAEKGMGMQLVENPMLVTGWRMRSHGILTDHSGKRALIELYRRITA